MGTKIKPVFKSEFPMANEGWHTFRITEAKIDAIASDEQKEKDSIKNDKNFVVRSAVEGGEDDGIEIQEFFANFSKKNLVLHASPVSWSLLAPSILSTKSMLIPCEPRSLRRSSKCPYPRDSLVVG